MFQLRMAKQRRPGGRPPVKKEVDRAALEAILARAQKAPLEGEDLETLRSAVDTLALMTQALAAKNASIVRLRWLMWGERTEKTSRIFPDKGGESEDDSANPESPEAKLNPAADPDASTAAPDSTKPKKPGHGRNGAAAYTGANRVGIPHQSLHRGQCCPECDKGKVYPLRDGKALVRVTGMAPLNATVYEVECMRCNLCGDVFEADTPPEIGKEKYDDSAAAMIAMFKYGAGLPFTRMEAMQKDFGMPLPAATAWEVVANRADSLVPAHQEMIRLAAQGDVIYNDDTTMTILALAKCHPTDKADPEADEKRTGVFTSGILSTTDGRRIALFFTGRKHAGENLASVLSLRAAETLPPIQMCDALSRNVPAKFQTVLASCLAHGRRKFVEIAELFPDECRFVLETLRDVYRNDELARERDLTAEERLALHQAESGPLMATLETWLAAQFAEKKVEPNSGLGQAIKYMRKHWEKLTLFLRAAGAPLDSNAVERALKKAILHRKNSYFYKTQNGARVGDIYMALIHTSELAGVPAFDYLLALLRNAEAVAEHPADWMPWNYTGQGRPDEPTGPQA